MSQIKTLLRQIENLSADRLADALVMNGYEQCVGVIRAKNIDGEEFLKLTEFQISLWRLPSPHQRRLWSFIQQIRRDPTHFIIGTSGARMTSPKEPMVNKPQVAERPTSVTHKLQAAQIKGRNETNFSTLSKKESSLLKNKLEQVLNRGDSDDLPNSSFIHSQRQPQLPPKPDHLKKLSMKTDDFHQTVEDPPDDTNDGYLSPIKVDPNKANKDAEAHPATVTKSYSFLNKFRKNGFDNLEVRPEVIENKYEDSPKTVQSRPLPPIPVFTVQQGDALTDDIEFETDDEDFGVYAPVIDDDKPPVVNEKRSPIVPRQQPDGANVRQMPPKPNSNMLAYESDEELAEYTSVLEEDDHEPRKHAPHGNTKPSTFHRPLPPIPKVQRDKQTSPVVNIGDSNDKGDKSVCNNKSAKLSKLRAELPKSPMPLPKDGSNLPKPPPLLPMSPDILMSTIAKDSLDFNFEEPMKNIKSTEPVKSNLDKRSEAESKQPEDIEDVIYTEVDLAMEPSYRETDRSGAKALLSGLDSGAFVLRPSRKSQYICTLSIMHVKKMFNIGIKKNSDGTFVFDTAAADFEQPKFYNIRDFINYYCSNPLYLSGELVVLKNLLPRNKR